MDRYTYDSDSDRATYSGFSVPDSVAAERMWHIFRLGKFAQHKKYDVILYPAGSRLLPLSSRIPGVAVVNDIISELLTTNDDFLYHRMIKKGLARVSKIIAASQYIKKDLISLSVDPTRIEVIHNGIDHSHFYPHTEFEGDVVDIKPFAIKKPYFIYASRLQYPQKKHVELIRAFSLFKQKTGLPHRLVLAGSDSVGASVIHKEASSSPYASDIFLTGYFPHKSLPQLYSYADACVFPAVSEGVGLPVIEAMAVGIPVVCAKSGALPEIAGNNAVYFNPDDIGDIAKAMELIVTSPSVRQKNIAGGFEWTKRFSWEKTAAKTSDVLRQVYQTKNRKQY
jgi:glycosyltransferase involved in cell wall biosynthesis